MHQTTDVGTMTAALEVGVTRSGAAAGMARLTPLHREMAAGLPGGEAEVRVILAELSPGDRTPRHSHRHPVTVYMLEGVFTLELDGREAVAIAAGEVFVEPAGVGMTGWNRGEVPARMVLFYACAPGVPFADPL